MKKNREYHRWIGFLAITATLAWGSSSLLAGDHGYEQREEGEHHHGGESAYRQLAPIANPKLKQECGSCHLVYHPGLLPARSWTKLMEGLDKHFGEDASLETAVKEPLTRILVENAADKTNSRRSQKMAASIAPSDTPLRITETPYFRRKHHEVLAEVWKRKKVGSPANCAACHPGAEKGEFYEEMVQIPR